MPNRQEKLSELIKRLSAQFLERESNHLSLITVTNCTVSPDGKRATVFISVFPETKEKAALDFSKRARSDLREYIKSKVSMKSIPTIDIVLDLGEKNRQLIEKATKGLSTN